VHRYQYTPGGNIQSSGKFEEILAAMVTASHKNGNGERQSWPLATL
jgi:hypothetical protein